MMEAKQKRQLAVFRYPGKRAGENNYAVIRPSRNDPDVWEIASSWFDDLERAKEELRQMRGAQR